MIKLPSFSFERPFAPIDIKACIAEFMSGSKSGKNKGRLPTERYASFDYCFNHFQSFRERGDVSSLATNENLTESCLHVAWYLASWGMLRNSHLLEKSLRAYEPLIGGLASFNRRVWEIDVDQYDKQTIDCLLDCQAMIREKLRDGARVPTDTLVTKVMLGVFGNVPAFDQYFRRGLRVGRMSSKSLIRIREFYDLNKELLDGYRIPTFDIATSGVTPRLYTKAKIIDMIGFVEGQRGDSESEL
jgi:hypothetical protein